MMSSSNWVYLQVAEVKRETDKAFEFLLEDGELVWIPKSQMADPADYEVGQTDLTDVAISNWIAGEKNLCG